MSDQLPPGEVTRPSPARMYDYFLGGTDNYAADRDAAEQVNAAHPETARLARYNRDFLVRAVRYCAEAGVRQFVDVGSGIPTSPNVHEVARESRADARVLYLDNDPIVLGHGRALFTGDPEIEVAAAEMRQPESVLAAAEASDVIDFTEPLALLCVSVFHFVTDPVPQRILAAYRERMAPGGHLVVSTVTSDDTDVDLMAKATEGYQNAGVDAAFRTGEQILRLFDGFDLVDPGIVYVSHWRADGNAETQPTALRIMAGVARLCPPDRDA